MDSIESRITVARLRRDRAEAFGHDGEAAFYEAEVEALITERDTSLQVSTAIASEAVTP